jgi:hypothetical protein
VPENEPPEYGSLLIAALLVLAIGFAGYWIWLYASTGSPPWNLARMFGIAALVVTLVGILRYIRR